MKALLKILVLILIADFGRAQDINFSQFYELPLLRNPALAGIYKGDIRVTSAYRNQWQSVPVGYQTQGLGVETKFGVGGNSDDFISLGVQLTNDVAGDGRLGKTQILPMLAYHKLVSYTRNMYLTAGFIGGAVSQRYDPTRLRFDDQFVSGAYSPTNPTFQSTTNTNITYWDAAFGLSLSSDFGYNNRFFIGAAYFHFNEPKVAFSALNDIRLNKKFVVNGGISVATSDYDYLTLYGDFFTQGGNTQIQGGAIFKHMVFEDANDENIAFSFGGFYRWNDAFVPLLKFDYYKWGMGITYDVNTSKLRAASQFRGGVELTLSFKSYLNIRNSSSEKFRCPIPFW